ncbi:MAG: hypothetical protein FWH36_03405 [Lentimicrobiaceae bacterium]|nr:hypothetical protein [Lentimicrobiaceae bacterium]
MKIYRKNLFPFFLALLVLFLNIMGAKTDTIHNSRFNPYSYSKIAIVSWIEVFHEWKYILLKSIMELLVIYVLYFLLREKTNNQKHHKNQHINK